MNTELGNCFPVALDLVVRREDGAYVLCHGMVEHPETGVHAHAWVEFTETHNVPLHDGSGTMPVTLTVCIDQSNGNDASLPAGFYYNIGRVHDVVKYQRTEAMRLAVQSGHYGPWT